MTAFATVAGEYRHLYGRPLKDDSLKAKFDEAASHMSRQDYGSAARLLEQIAQTAEVPAVYTDLGLVYLAQDDRGNAVNAFREALARDIGYEPARKRHRRYESDRAGCGDAAAARNRAE